MNNKIESKSEIINNNMDNISFGPTELAAAMQTSSRNMYRKFKNLNQLRRTLREGTQLEILDHCRPECIGQIRNITLVNTQGFYSTVANQPDASANRGNGGRGPILWWGRAAHWQFADGVCSVFDSEQKHTEEELVMSFRVLEKEAA
jgi:hypothetical protein